MRFTPYLISLLLWMLPQSLLAAAPTYYTPKSMGGLSVGLRAPNIKADSTLIVPVFSSAPSISVLRKGDLYYNSGDSTVYRCTGGSWASLAGTTIAATSLTDTLRLAFPDTTLALSGKRVLDVNLNDGQWTCVNPTIQGSSYSCGGSFAKFRETEKNTSIHNAATRGGAAPNDSLNVMPSLVQWQITTAGDSLVALDLTTGRIWWVLKSAAANACSSGTFNDFDFKDGIVHLATSKGKCDLDFQQDMALIYTTAGVWKYKGNLNQRNDGLHQDLLAATPAIVSNTVNTVSTTRNPFGQADRLGRLLQFWGVGTSTRSTYYNPITNTLNDLTGGNNSRNSMVITSRGSVYETVDMASGTFDTLAVTYSIFKYTADANATDRAISGGGFGASKLAWANTSALPRVAVVERGSVAGNMGDVAVLGSDLGAYFIHYFPGVSAAKPDTAGVKIRLTGNYIGAPEFGDCVLSAVNGDNTTDASPYGNDLTAVSSPAFNAASTSVIFSGAYSSKNGTLLKRFDTDFRLTALQQSSLCVWVKSASATNFSGSAQYLLSAGVSAGLVSVVAMNPTTGTVFFERVGGGGDDTATSTADFCDGNWHLLVGNFTGTSTDLYVDGRLSASDASVSATGALATDTLFVGGFAGLACHFDGKLSQGSYNKRALSATEISWLYKRGPASLQVEPAGRHLTGLAVNYVQSYGSNVVMGNQDSCVVWDAILGLPLPKRRYGSPGGNIQDVALIPGAADSLGISMVTTTKTQVIQPDPRLIDLAQARGPFVQPAIGERVVVDSAGVAGLFWSVDDAIDAGYNANRTAIFICAGTYPGFTIDYNSLLIEGSGILASGYPASGSTVILGNGSAAAITYTSAAAHTTLTNLTARTGPGGGGGGFSAIVIPANANRNSIDNVGVAGSDNDCINNTGDQNSFTHLWLYGCDGDGIEFTTGDDNIFNDNHVLNQGGSSILINASSTTDICDSNRLDGAVSGTCTGTNDATAY